MRLRGLNRENISFTRNQSVTRMDAIMITAKREWSPLAAADSSENISAPPETVVVVVVVSEVTAVVIVSEDTVVVVVSEGTVVVVVSMETSVQQISARASLFSEHVISSIESSHKTCPQIAWGISPEVSLINWRRTGSSTILLRSRTWPAGHNSQAGGGGSSQPQMAPTTAWLEAHCSSESMVADNHSKVPQVTSPIMASV
mmetsp:Transcript_4893/g.13931  ORF Transcript_4893/g.13931 Transcript_4893/m.13931 type:complete len:201 (+) Transcript_4893:167-769(+)